MATQNSRPVATKAKRRKPSERAKRYAAGIYVNPKYWSLRGYIQTAWLVGYRAAKSEAYADTVRRILEEARA